MILNIFLTGLTFFVLFFWIAKTVGTNDVSARVEVVVVGGYLASAATIFVTALVLIWTRG
jgi:predicted membrane-bound mannosyltransferase